MLGPARHQCLIYDGSPLQILPSVAAMARQKLAENLRCVYLNSPQMVECMRTALTAAGVDVADEVKNGRLIMSSERGHLVQGHFDIDRMMGLLSEGLTQALQDGFRGLWATGDMTWEFGPEGGDDKLLDYEWRLEEFFRRNPGLCGVCQYHADTLPPSVVRKALVSHPALFINETLLRINSHYVPPEVFSDSVLEEPALDEAIAGLCCAVPG